MEGDTYNEEVAKKVGAEFEAGYIDGDDVYELPRVKFGAKQLSASDIPATAKTPGLDPITIDEVNMYTNLLGVLMEGPSKPNSPLFELNKIQRDIVKAERNGWATEDLKALKETIKGCCPTSSTVKDSLIYKPHRAAILNRIVELTGLDAYINKYKEEDRRY